VFLLLYAVSYAVGLVTSLLVTPIAIVGSFLFINPVMRGQFPQEGTLDIFVWMITVLSVIGLLPGLVYRVFSSTVWTLSYRQWQRQS
jgi:hypothetical protein